jgi:opacity protein-like surface antigen
MSKRILQVFIASSFVLVPLVAFAQAPAAPPPDGVAGRYSFTVKGGLETNWGGKMSQSGSGQILGLPAEVDESKFNDAYGPGYRISLGAGYGFTRNIEGIVAFSFGKLGSDETAIGTVAGAQLRAAFDDYSDWTLEFGGRYHVWPDRTLDPYVSAVFGFRRVDSIPVDFTVPDIGISLTNVGFYDESTVAMFGFDVGFEYKIGPNASIGAETGYRWQAKPGSVEGFEPATGLSDINGAGSRYALPFLGFVTFRFE